MTALAYEQYGYGCAYRATGNLCDPFRGESRHDGSARAIHLVGVIVVTGQRAHVSKSKPPVPVTPPSATSRSTVRRVAHPKIP